MLEERGIRKGIEVLVFDPTDARIPPRKGLVVRTYPHPSRWLVVKFDSGDVEEVDESHITTMFEERRKTSPI